MLDTIALKIADGSLRPIINTTAQNHRRVVLSTEADNQEKIVVELYHGVGREVFDHQLIDTISIDHIPSRIRQDLDIVLNLSVSDAGELDVRISIEGTNIAFGNTYNLAEPAPVVDLDSYILVDESVDLSTVPAETTETIGPIDEDFVLGIDPYISYKKEDVRREEWGRAKKKINKGMRISGFLTYVLIITSGLLLLAFLVYLGIVLTPLPPLEV